MIGDASLAAVLPDVILDAYTADQAKENLVAIKKRFQEMRALQIIVEGLAQEDLSKYGIVDCGAVTSLEGSQTASMTRIIEKPSLEDAPSNLAVVGRYVLYKSI